MLIRIYAGPGTDNALVMFTHQAFLESHLTANAQISLITPETLNSNAWQEDTSLLVIPGGQDTVFTAALSDKAKQNIRDYIAVQGGKYLGICMGAYTASGNIIFNRGAHDEVAQSRDLLLFPGQAIGPLNGLPHFTAQLDSLHFQLVRWNDGSVYPALYFGGPYFGNTELFAEVKVLAYYMTVIPSLPAIIKVRSGTGLAVLSGVHPEIRASDLYNILAARESGISKADLKRQAFAAEKDRQLLWQKIVSSLEL